MKSAVFTTAGELGESSIVIPTFGREAFREFKVVEALESISWISSLYD
jgi:hypothetical protein